MIHDPKNFAINRYSANPNTFPDSPSNGESGEVCGFALHQFVTRLHASVVIDYPWCNVVSYAFRRYVYLAPYASSRWASFGVKCSKGLILSPSAGKAVGQHRSSSRMLKLAHNSWIISYRIINMSRSPEIIPDNWMPANANPCFVKEEVPALLSLYCIWRQMAPRCWMHMMLNAPTFWMHMTP